ncbi:MAG: hypothetical protein R2822_19960 [Spirosomataceae bacterium]
MAIPVMIVNGTADRTNPIYRGEVLANGISLGLVRSTDRTFKYWYELAGYTGAPKMETLPDTDPADRRTIEKYTFSATNKPEVTLLKVINGAHNYLAILMYIWKPGHFSKDKSTN